MNKSTATEILTAVSYGWQDTYPGLTDENKLIKVPQVFTTPNFNGCELNRLFYWDTYFSNRGLIHLGYEFRARSNTDALIQLLNVTGFVPNINVPGGDNRSQVPYLCQMVMDNYLSSGDKDYLEEKIGYIKNEYLFWTDERKSPCGLNRFHHNATEQDLQEFYNYLVVRLGFDPDSPREEMLRKADHYMTEAESSVDFTSRFMGEASDYAAMDLNANLAYYERTIARISNELGRTDEEMFWERRFQRRRELINTYMWNEETGFFHDYNFVKCKQSPVKTPVAYSMMLHGIATREQAAKMVANLSFLEKDYGVVATDNMHLHKPFQWDFPFGWPPYQFITVHALKNYGYNEHAARIAHKYLDLVGSIYEKTGFLWEKYDVVNGKVVDDVEYGTETQLGWTAGVYIDFCQMYHPEIIEKVKRKNLF